MRCHGIILPVLAALGLALPVHGALVKNLTFDTLESASSSGTLYGSATVASGSGIYSPGGMGSLKFTDCRDGFKTTLAGLPTTGTMSLWFNVVADNSPPSVVVDIWEVGILGQDYAGPSGFRGHFMIEPGSLGVLPALAPGADWPNILAWSDNLIPSLHNGGLLGAPHLVTMSWDAKAGIATSSASMWIDGALQVPANYTSLTQSGVNRFANINQLGFGMWGEFADGSMKTGWVAGVGWTDDYALWNTQLTNTQAVALYRLGGTGVSGVKYGAKDATTLFDTFALQHPATTSDGKQWAYVSNGLAGNLGAVGSNFVVLGAGGAGMQIVPEPGMLGLFAVATVTLLGYSMRRRPFGRPRR